MFLMYWSKLLNTTCEAIRVEPYGFVTYPIYKNGRTSLWEYATDNNCKTFINEELKTLDHIIVYLRNPLERFISGVHTYLEFENLGSQEDTILKQIEEMTVCDRHFVPQFIWLIHLSKYFKGTVRIDSVSELYQAIPNRGSPSIPEITNKRKQKIKKINSKNYTDIDEKIIEKYMCKSIKLETLIKEFYNVLS